MPYINDMVVKYDCVVYLREKNTKDVFCTAINMANYRSVIGNGIEDKLFFLCLFKRLQQSRYFFL